MFGVLLEIFEPLVLGRQIQSSVKIQNRIDIWRKCNFLWNIHEDVWIFSNTFDIADYNDNGLWIAIGLPVNKEV